MHGYHGHISLKTLHKVFDTVAIFFSFLQLPVLYLIFSSSFLCTFVFVPLSFFTSLTPLPTSQLQSPFPHFPPPLLLLSQRVICPKCRLGVTRIQDLSHSDMKKVRQLALIDMTALCDLLELEVKRHKTGKRKMPGTVWQHPHRKGE